MHPRVRLSNGNSRAIARMIETTLNQANYVQWRARNVKGLQTQID